MNLVDKWAYEHRYELCHKDWSKNEEVWKNFIKADSVEDLKEHIGESLDGGKIYPTDIFPEIHEELLEEINQELQNKFEFPLDRLSAHISRRILKGVKEKLIGK